MTLFDTLQNMNPLAVGCVVAAAGLAIAVSVAALVLKLARIQADRYDGREDGISYHDKVASWRWAATFLMPADEDPALLTQPMAYSALGGKHWSDPR